MAKCGFFSLNEYSSNNVLKSFAELSYRGENGESNNWATLFRQKGFSSSSFSPFFYVPVDKTKQETIITVNLFY